MSVVNFSITDALAKNIEKMIQKLGFSSRAEFFRAAAIQFIAQQTKHLTPEERFDVLSDTLDEVVHRKFKDKNLPSLEQQLANL